MGTVNFNSGLTPFGRWVKTQALVSGTELKDVARDVGISKNYLSAIIHGN